MITKLRKRHRRVWLVIAVVLPLLFIAAYTSIPKYQLQESPSNTINESLITLKFPMKAWLTKSETGAYHLGLYVNEYESSVAAQVYLTNIELNDYVKNGYLIGTVNGAGEYSFTVKPEILEPHHNFIVIYDPIKQKQIYNPIRVEE